MTEHPELHLDPGQKSGKEKKYITNSNQDPFFIRKMVIKNLQNLAVNTVCLYLLELLYASPIHARMYKHAHAYRQTRCFSM